MLLAIDIGNTNIVLGIYSDNRWLHHWRIQTVIDRMPDEYAIMLQSLFLQANIDFNAIEASVLSSVVPVLTPRLVELLTKHLPNPPKVLRPDSKHGLSLATQPAEFTGTDLIANAIAAKALCQTDALIVDFGTATTIMALQRPNVFLGGIIAAGLRTTSKALVGATSQLPSVPLALPKQVIGNNSIAAMQSGLVLGHLCMIEGLLNRLKATLNDPTVIATGGLAETLCHNQNFIDRIEPWLTLDGLRLFAENSR